MKKWFKFFFLGFFSNKFSKDGARRGYTNFFLSFVLLLAFLWAGFIGCETLPFGFHYNNAPDFKQTVHQVIANENAQNQVYLEISEGSLKAKLNGEEFGERLLVNTFESESDKQKYSVNGYNVVVDMRPADTIAEVEAYCVSNDGKNLEISYQEYLTLSEVAKLNFDFKLRYTGNALQLTSELIEECKAYVEGLSDENKTKTQTLKNDLSENKITEEEYNRAIYELYFTNYYPKITAYESTSKVPLLRNYYYHNYISAGAKNYLFIFDDNLSACFKTKSGIILSFYGFFSNFENGVIISQTTSQAQATALADGFIKKSFNAVLSLNLYANALNVISLAPFIALMPMVVTLLIYSILKLRGIESINSFGSLFKIIGSYSWFSGVISAVISTILAFFVQRNLLTSLPLVIFFITLVIRSAIFAIDETKTYKKQLEIQTNQTEV